MPDRRRLPHLDVHGPSSSPSTRTTIFPPGGPTIKANGWQQVSP